MPGVTPTYCQQPAQSSHPWPVWSLVSRQSMIIQLWTSAIILISLNKYSTCSFSCSSFSEVKGIRYSFPPKVCPSNSASMNQSINSLVFFFPRVNLLPFSICQYRSNSDPPCQSKTDPPPLNYSNVVAFVFFWI